MRADQTTDLLADADVVIAVDVGTGEQEIVQGCRQWDLALEAGREEDLVILRVELDADSDDLEWLLSAIEAIGSGETDDNGDGLADGEDDY